MKKIKNSCIYILYGKKEFYNALQNKATAFFWDDAAGLITILGPHHPRGTNDVLQLSGDITRYVVTKA